MSDLYRIDLEQNRYPEQEDWYKSMDHYLEVLEEQKVLVPAVIDFDQMTAVYEKNVYGSIPAVDVMKAAFTIAVGEVIDD